MIFIPKVFQQIWLGGKPLPEPFARWRNRWAELHPSWICRIWQQGERLDVLRSDVGAITGHLAALTTACHLSQRSNIWRYDLIDRFGGVYLDTDMEPLRNIEPLIEGQSAFAGRFFVRGQERICPAIFGATPGHPWSSALVDGLAACNPSLKGSMGSSYFGAITRSHPAVKVFDPQVFYSGPMPGGAFDTHPLPDDAFAVHHWSSTWLAGSFAPLA